MSLYLDNLNQAYGSINPNGPHYHEDWFGATGSGIIAEPQSVYRDIFDEVKALNQAQWDREDSSYQRMVADMKKAGLNPWSGISSGGLSSSPGSSASKSAIDSLIQVLDYNTKTNHYGNEEMISAVNTGIKMALPFLAVLGI